MSEVLTVQQLKDLIVAAKAELKESEGFYRSAQIGLLIAKDELQLAEEALAELLSSMT